MGSGRYWNTHHTLVRKALDSDHEKEFLKDSGEQY